MEHLRHLTLGTAVHKHF